MRKKYRSKNWQAVSGMDTGNYDTYEYNTNIANTCSRKYTES